MGTFALVSLAFVGGFGTAVISLIMLTLVDDPEVRS